MKLGDRPPEEHDELARDLPGLPTEEVGLVANENGLSYVTRGRPKTVNIAWRDLTGLTPLDTRCPKDRRILLLTGLASAGGAEERTVRTRVTLQPSHADAIGSAWREYSLRRIRTEGCLRGGVHLLALRLRLFAGLWLSAIYGCIGAYSAYQTSRMMVEYKDAPQFLALLWLVTGLFLLPVVAGLLFGVSSYLRIRRMGRYWSEWELRKSGLQVRHEHQEMSLNVTAHDRVGAKTARLQDIDIPLEHLTHYEVAAPLLLAMAEREGARLNEKHWLWSTATLLPLVVAAGYGAFCMQVAGIWPPDGDGGLVVLLGLVLIGLACVPAYAEYDTRRRTHKMLAGLLAEGRDFLMRLGW